MQCTLVSANGNEGRLDGSAVADFGRGHLEPGTPNTEHGAPNQALWQEEKQPGGALPVAAICAHG